MAFKTVLSLDAEVTFAIGGVDKKTKKKNPTQAEGYYLGKRVVEGGKYGPSTIFFLQTPKGNVGIWGKTNLNNQMAGVSPGCMIRITYAGQVPTPAGDMHKYKVEVDEDNTIDVSALSNSTDTEEAVEDTEEDDQVGQTPEDDEFTDEYEAPEAVAVKSNVGKTDRAAKVAALLSNKK